MSTNRRPSDLVEQFEHDYAEAYAQACKAQETTATDGWQQLYAGFISNNQKYRDNAAHNLELLSNALHDRPLTPDSLKDLKEAVKDAVAACEAAQTFDAQTVAPLRSTVENLHRIIADYEGKANAAASQTPLTDSYLPDQMAEAIMRKPKATWNPRIGVINFTNDKSSV